MGKERPDTQEIRGKRGLTPTHSKCNANNRLVIPAHLEPSGGGSSYRKDHVTTKKQHIVNIIKPAPTAPCERRKCTVPWRFATSSGRLDYIRGSILLRN